MVRTCWLSRKSRVIEGNHGDDNIRANLYIRRKPVELGEYTIILPQKAYQCNFNDQTVTITQGENNVVLRYPIQEIIRQDTMLLHHPEQLLTYLNDSLMLVLEGICFEDTIVTDVRYYGLQLFKKKPSMAAYF